MSCRRPARRAARWSLLLLPLALPWRCRLDDLGAYWAWGQALRAHGWPYRDFAFEYPPLALTPLVLPAILTCSRGGFVAAYTVALSALDVGMRLTAMPWRTRDLTGIAIGTLLQLPLYAVALRRLDGVAVAAVTLALHLLVRRPHGQAAWAALGVGLGIKLYPALLWPPMALYAWRRGARRRQLALGAVVAAAGLAVPTAVAAVGAGAGALQWLHYHHDRGLHGATTYVAWHLLRAGLGTPLPTAFRHGTQEVTAPWAEGALAWAPAFTAVAGATTLAAMLPRQRDAAGLYRTALALLVALVLTAKVFSPQYVLWLLPLTLAAARLSSGTDRPLVGGMVAVACLTGMLYPGETLMLAGQPRRQVALVARTAVLAGLWLYLVVGRKRSSRRSPSSPLTRPTGDAQTILPIAGDEQCGVR